MAAFASPAVVRAWANANGFPTGKRGVIAPAAVKAYNAANGLKYKAGAHVPTVTVKAKPAQGRTVTRSVNLKVAREALAAQGHKVGARGRLSQEALSTYVLSL